MRLSLRHHVLFVLLRIRFTCDDDVRVRSASSVLKSGIPSSTSPVIYKAAAWTTAAADALNTTRRQCQHPKMKMGFTSPHLASQPTEQGKYMLANARDIQEHSIRRSIIWIKTYRSHFLQDKIDNIGSSFLSHTYPLLPPFPLITNDLQGNMQSRAHAYYEIHVNLFAHPSKPEHRDRGSRDTSRAGVWKKG